MVNGLFEKFAKLDPRVMVLRGPPGCGKTSLAELVYWEAQRRNWETYAVVGLQISSFDWKSLVTSRLTLDVAKLEKSERNVLLVIDDIQSMYCGCEDAAYEAEAKMARASGAEVPAKPQPECNKCCRVNALLHWLCRGSLGSIHVLITAVYYDMGYAASPSYMSAFHPVGLQTLMWKREEAISCFDRMIESCDHEGKVRAVKACMEKILSLCETPHGFHIGLVRKMTAIALEIPHTADGDLEAAALRALAFKSDLMRFFPLAGNSSRNRIDESERKGLVALLRSPGPINADLLGARLKRDFLRICIVCDVSPPGGGVQDTVLVQIMSPLARRSICQIYFATEATSMFPSVSDLVVGTVKMFSSERLREMTRASTASLRLRLGKEIGIQHEFYRAMMQVIPIGCECVPETTDPGNVVVSGCDQCVFDAEVLGTRTADDDWNSTFHIFFLFFFFQLLHLFFNRFERKS